MNIELTTKEFRRLLDLVFIGNWVLNSTRGDDRFEDYDNVESKLFALCKGTPMESLVEDYNGKPIPSQASASRATSRCRSVPAGPRTTQTRPCSGTISRKKCSYPRAVLAPIKYLVPAIIHPSRFFGWSQYAADTGIYTGTEKIPHR